MKDFIELVMYISLPARFKNAWLKKCESVSERLVIETDSPQLLNCAWKTE